MLKAQDEMLRLLRESGIPAAILKGCAAAIYYPRPELRAMGDIDFLVRESDYKRAEQLLSQNEYVVTHEEQKGGHHIRFVKNGIAF